MFRVKICTALVTIHIHKLFTHSRTHHFIITHMYDYKRSYGNCLTFLVSGLDFLVVLDRCIGWTKSTDLEKCLKKSLKD